jgi:hypothetical protein
MTKTVSVTRSPSRTGPRILYQSVGDGSTCRARTNDDVVITSCWHRKSQKKKMGKIALKKKKYISWLRKLRKKIEASKI